MAGTERTFQACRAVQQACKHLCRPAYKNIDDNGIFKALVGEDYMTVEKKNRTRFPSCLLQGSCFHATAFRRTMATSLTDSTDASYHHTV